MTTFKTANDILQNFITSKVLMYVKALMYMNGSSRWYSSTTMYIAY